MNVIICNHTKPDGSSLDVPAGVYNNLVAAPHERGIVDIHTQVSISLAGFTLSRDGNNHDCLRIVIGDGANATSQILMTSDEFIDLITSLECK